MYSFRNYETYKEELEDILSFNPVEYELYSIIADIIRNSDNFSEYYLRDVSHDRTCEITKHFKGCSGFPDFVVTSKGPEHSKVGAVEVKVISKNIDKGLEQVKGHIESFGNVIYTNGLEWRFYDKDFFNNYNKAKWSFQLATLNGREITLKNQAVWNDLLKALNDITWQKNKTD